MALSKRLSAIYQMVDKGSIVADIGCDHAQLSIALAQNDICPHVYACDLREQPLARAAAAIQAAGLTKRITPCLQNGLDSLSADVTTVVIAGMGVETALHILNSHPEELKDNRSFIIQVNNHVDKLRTWIGKHHFTIEKEALVEEDHFYEIVCFRCKYHDAYSEKEQLFGVYIPQEQVFERYLKYRIEKLDVILNQLPSHHIRRKTIEMRRSRLQQQLNEYRDHK